MDSKPLILLISGKRKSGKDYICERLQSLLKEDATIIRISAPLKGLYAKEHDLDLDALLSDGPYKEKYRKDMIKWSDEVREKDPGFFCKVACDDAKLTKIWIVSDVRRKSDLKWFYSTYGDSIKTIKVSADLKTRKDRGYVFTPGVDDVDSECNLDDVVSWDLEIKNNNDQQLTNGIKKVLFLTRTE